MLVTHCSTSQQDSDVKTELDKLSVSVSEQEQVNNVNLYCFSNVTVAYIKSFCNKPCLMHT